MLICDGKIFNLFIAQEMVLIDPSSILTQRVVFAHDKYLYVCTESLPTESIPYTQHFTFSSDQIMVANHYTNCFNVFFHTVRHISCRR